MGNAKEKTLKIPAALSPAARKAIREMGFIADERGGDAIADRAWKRRAHAAGRPLRTSHAVILSKRDGSPVTARDVEHVRAAIEAVDAPETEAERHARAVAAERAAHDGKKSSGLKNGGTKTVGAATITKTVVRSTVRVHGAATFSQGRRSFQSTTYIVKAGGRVLDVVASYSAAVALAEKA